MPAPTPACNTMLATGCGLFDITLKLWMLAFEPW